MENVILFFGLLSLNVFLISCVRKMLKNERQKTKDFELWYSKELAKTAHRALVNFVSKIKRGV